MKRLLRRKTAVLGLAVVLTVILCAVFAPALAPRDPNRQNLDERLKPPAWLDGGSASHLLGTDHLGRDLLSRLIFGSRISLIVGFLATVVSGVLGTTLGLIAGYYGGPVDRVVGRLSEIQMAFPFILLTIAIIAALGPGLLNLILVIGVANWVVYARTTRGAALSVRAREFVEAARALGDSDARIIVWHILPNVIAPVIVIATLSLAEI
ncbi:MAG: ABC transporter permease, partial [Bacillota bacterium]